MSDYEPFEAAQGDPWSTDPVGDSSRQRREPEAETYQEDSQVVARVPHVGEEPATDQYRNYGHSRSSHRGRRSHSQRPGIPAPVWVVVGMGLVVLIAAPFLLFNNSADEAALDVPSWETQMPAPDADLAPAWPSDNGSSQWPQSAARTPGTATAEPTTPDAWSTAGEWVGAPPNALYANNAADSTEQTPAQPDAGSFPANMTSSPATSSLTGPSPNAGWDNSISPAAPSAPVEPGYQTLGTTPRPAYPATNGQPAAPWANRATTSVEPSMTQPTTNADSWDRTPLTPSLATPQPENVMPGYGNYPTVQPNPYVGSSPQSAGPQGPYAGTDTAARNALQQRPNYAPQYPVAGQSATESYPVPNYPQTAMSPKPAAPVSSVPTGGRAYPSQRLAPPSTYPPTARNPYPQAAPASPAGQPGYGAGASTEASQRSVARLNGTIQEPATRQAYDDRARHSYY